MNLALIVNSLVKRYKIRDWELIEDLRQEAELANLTCPVPTDHPAPEKYRAKYIRGRLIDYVNEVPKHTYPLDETSPVQQFTPGTNLDLLLHSLPKPSRDIIELRLKGYNLRAILSELDLTMESYYYWRNIAREKFKGEL